MIRLILASIILINITSCATLFKEETSESSLQITDKEKNKITDYQVYVDGKLVGENVETLVLDQNERGQGHTIKITSTGYEPYETYLKTSRSDLWAGLDIGLGIGGIITIFILPVVDASNDKWYDYPQKIQVVLEKE